MANTRIQVFYQRGEGDKWTNVYHADAASLPALSTAFTSIMQVHLLNMLDPSVRIVKALFSSMTDDTFVETSIEEPGVLFGAGSLLPFFNRVKLLFATAGLGRPDVKFLGGWVGEDNSASGVNDPTKLADLVTEFNTLIEDMDANGTPLQSEAGDAWNECTAQPGIQMRQLHRRRKRVVVP